MINVREELLKLQLKDMIKETSFEVGDYTLQSGQRSKYYINMKPLLHNQCFMYLLTSLIKDYIMELKNQYNVTIKGIGGPGYGACPISAATLMRLIEVDDRCVNNIYSFTLRSEKKDYGVHNHLDGLINPNDAVMIIDDVITTGENILKTISACMDYDIRPIAIFSIVNRNNLNLHCLTDRVFYIKNLFTLKDFIND